MHLLESIKTTFTHTGLRIVFLELVINETQANFSSVSIDRQMFMGTKGRVRSLNEWLLLFSKSGVELEEVVNLRSLGKILVLRTAS